MSEESQEQYGGVLAAPVRHPRRRRAAIVAALHVAAALVVVVLIVPGSHHVSPTLSGTLTATGTLGDSSSSQPVSSLAFSPDGTMLATADGFYGAHIWHLATRAMTNLNGGGGTNVAFSPDGATLAIPAGNTVYLWDVATSRRIAALNDPSRTVNWWSSVAFSPDGTTLAVADGNGTTYLWQWTQPAIRS